MRTGIGTSGFSISVRIRFVHTGIALIGGIFGTRVEIIADRIAILVRATHTFIKGIVRAGVVDVTKTIRIFVLTALAAVVDIARTDIHAIANAI
jgi:hypothetical protein